MLNIFKSLRKEREFQKVFQLALQYEKSGELDKALEKLKTLVDEQPRNVHVRRELALLQKKMGMHIDLPSVKFPPPRPN